jgi:hypothetical protein
MTASGAMCPVEGCGFRAKTPGGLGPHSRKHRSREIVPTGNAAAPRVADVDGGDVADTIVDLLYPDGVPTGHVREVASWMASTEHLVELARS